MRSIRLLDSLILSVAPRCSRRSLQQAALPSSTYPEPPVVRSQYVTGTLFSCSSHVFSSGRRKTRHVFSLPSRRPSTANELARRVDALAVTAEQQVRLSSLLGVSLTLSLRKYRPTSLTAKKSYWSSTKTSSHSLSMKLESPLPPCLQKNEIERS